MALQLFTKEKSYLKNIMPDQFLIDLHVHTRCYSSCAETLDPYQIAAFLKGRSLNAVVLTEHDQLWKKDDIDRLNDNGDGVRFFRGVEVTGAEGHFVVIGLNDLRNITKGICLDQLIEIAHDKGAAVILPHPHLMQAKLSVADYGRVLKKELDGIEVISTVTTSTYHKKALSISEKYHITAVGGSDAHALPFVGEMFTVFKEIPLDESAIAKQIRDGTVMAGTFKEKTVRE